MWVVEAVGFCDVVCADVRGATFDVGLIVYGRPLLSSTSIIHHRVMYRPTIDLVAIGTGRRRHRPRGPRHAPPEGGPRQCRRRTGNCLLWPWRRISDRHGRQSSSRLHGPDRFLGGKVKLDRQAAVYALQKHVAGPMSVDVKEAAAAVFAIVNAMMVDLVRKITVERGHDPRDFALCAYGGLGTLHAPFYAGDLHLKALIIPLGELS